MTRTTDFDLRDVHNQIANLAARLQSLESAISARGSIAGEAVSVDVLSRFVDWDNEFDFFEAETTGDVQLYAGLNSREVTWKDRRSSAVSFTQEKAVLNNNGDALHSLHIHNHSDIHNKRLNGYIKVIRSSTNAEVFRFGYIYAYHHTNKGGDHISNQYYDNVKKHWSDISAGNMRYEANWHITSIHS